MKHSGIIYPNDGLVTLRLISQAGKPSILSLQIHKLCIIIIGCSRTWACERIHAGEECLGKSIQELWFYSSHWWGDKTRKTVIKNHIRWVKPASSDNASSVAPRIYLYHYYSYCGKLLHSLSILSHIEAQFFYLIFDSLFPNNSHVINQIQEKCWFLSLKNMLSAVAYIMSMTLHFSSIKIISIIIIICSRNPVQHW